jgi:hypothetical protein
MLKAKGKSIQPLIASHIWDVPDSSIDGWHYDLNEWTNHEEDFLEDIVERFETKWKNMHLFSFKINCWCEISISFE